MSDPAVTASLGTGPVSKNAGVTGSRAHTRTDQTSRPLAPSIRTASALVNR
jgi:hypothetical protein